MRFRAFQDISERTSRGSRKVSEAFQEVPESYRGLHRLLGEIQSDFKRGFSVIIIRFNAFQSISRRFRAFQEISERLYGGFIGSRMSFTKVTTGFQRCFKEFTGSQVGFTGVSRGGSDAL